jgi:hypothetical protein
MHRKAISRRTLLIAAAVAAVGLTLAALPAGGRVRVHAAGCPDVVIFGARGSGETAKLKENNIGPELNYMALRLQRQLQADGQSVEIKQIQYEALGFVQALIPSKGVLALLPFNPVAAYEGYIAHSYNHYMASISGGISDTIQTVDEENASCPDTDIVLEGYSQGAMVVHQAELRMDNQNDDAVNTIVGGDGDRVSNTQATIIGGAARSGRGIRSYFHNIVRFKPREVDDPESTVEICAKHDFVCDFTGAGSLRHAFSYTGVHTGYLKAGKPDLNAAADWLGGQLTGP